MIAIIVNQRLRLFIGTPLALSLGMKPNTVEHILNRIDPLGPNGCWTWTGSHCSGGYGQTMYLQKIYRVHRFVYEHLVEPIPEGFFLDHLCLNRGCCNPDHLEPVTPAENALRTSETRMAKNPNPNRFALATRRYRERKRLA